MTLTVDLHHHVIPEFYWQASNEDGVDTSRAIAKLHDSTSPNPDVKYVFAHAGGTIPFVASRFAIVDRGALRP